MKLRYLSDLHLEFIKSNKIEKFIEKIPPGLDEICILAGDIGNPYQTNYDKFMKFISENFKQTFIISGNHEYYNETKTIHETNKYMEDYFQKFNNISFLNNAYKKYNDYYFIGTTLWSKIINPIYKINDVSLIPQFDCNEYNKLNMLSVKFLEDTLQELSSHKEKCVMITHHLPSKSLIDVKYKTMNMLPYNQWFYCDMDELIKKYNDKIKCWIYGHTHTQSNCIINNISFLCNPIGYPNENKEINFERTFELP